MSGSFESVRWNARVHRLDLGLYSHPKEVFFFLFPGGGGGGVGVLVGGGGRGSQNQGKNHLYRKRGSYVLGRGRPAACVCHLRHVGTQADRWTRCSRSSCDHHTRRSLPISHVTASLPTQKEVRFPELRAPSGNEATLDRKLQECRRSASDDAFTSSVEKNLSFPFSSSLSSVPSPPPPSSTSSSSSSSSQHGQNSL